MSYTDACIAAVIVVTIVVCFTVADPKWLTTTTCCPMEPMY